MSWLDSLFSFLKKDVKVEPKSLGWISYDQTVSLLKPHTENLFLSDLNFNVTDIEQVKIAIANDNIANQKYIAEGHDCDNYSYALMGYFSQWSLSFAFGVAWSSTHAFNIAIDQNHQIWIIEPQNNTCLTLEEAKKNKSYYPLKLIVI